MIDLPSGPGGVVREVRCYALAALWPARVFDTCIIQTVRRFRVVLAGSHYNMSIYDMAVRATVNFCDGRQRDRLKFHLSLFENRDNGSMCSANAQARPPADDDLN